MSHSAYRLSALILLSGWLSVQPAAHAQVKDTRSFRREMRVGKRGDRLIMTQGDFHEIFTKKLRQRLSSGFTSIILVDVQLRARGKKAPLAQMLLQFTILYDIWEERFHVRQEGYAGRKELDIGSMEDLVRLCGNLQDLPLARWNTLPPDAQYELRVRFTVNPTSREMRRKVREYLANPDGRGHIGSPRSFFGSFSRIFVSEKDFQADAVYTYTSNKRFRLPTGEESRQAP